MKIRFWLCMALWVIMSVLGTFSAQSQIFTNTTPGNINDNTLCPGATGSGTTANLTRTINVSGLTGTVTDLNVGFLATHTWRGDIRLTLTSPGPSSTSVVLINEDTSGSGNDDDYNVEMGDEAAVLINTGAVDGPHDTTQPTFQFLARPNNPLSVFNGIAPNGVWTLDMCDDYAGQNGQFLQADLIFAPSTGADLSLTASTATTSPEIGSTISMTFNVINSGPEAAGGVTTQINLPAGLTYVSQVGSGSFEDTSGVWTLPSPIAASSTTSIVIDVFVEPVGPYNASAEISASGKTDFDSTPNNGSTTEDDDIATTFTPVPSTTPPSLTCLIGDQFSLLWDSPGNTNGWPAGSLTNSYTVGGETINFAITGNTNRFISRTYSGSTLQTPVTTTQFANGPNVGEHGVVMNVDYAATSENVLTTIDLGTTAKGVDQLQFQIIDVDDGTWIDRIVVTGTFDGNIVIPVLTTSGSNTTSGTDTFLGTGGAPTGSTAGNATITFLSPVDQVTFSYNNASTTTNPVSQVISLQKLVMCPSLSADLSAVKSVAVAPPGVYMTPGNEVLYTITVINSATATADADAIDLSDTLPETVRFVSATTTGFTGGAFGSPALPPANTDCTGGACVIHYSGATLPIDSTGEIVVRAMIK